ncbi:MAG: FAD-binding protein [Spirochaetes bacterium]|nr:FAD-binding protein [Spirochaetota bacterium]
MAERAAIAEALRLLCARIPTERVFTDKTILEHYARDETPDLSYTPDIVVMPISTQEVSEIVKICAHLKIPLTPRGKGTGVAGGALPIDGGIVLSFERMNKIIEIDPKNLIAIVEPGVITREIDNAAKQFGLMYPPDPSSLDSCSIGGNVAVGAGGPRAVKYGTTRDYVIGLECVCANGEIIALGGKYVKNATGYGLIPLLVGSEGTLALITKIVLRLLPRPTASLAMLIPFDDIGLALTAAEKIIMAKIIPAAIEFMEEDALRLVKEYFFLEMPFPTAQAHLLIEIDGSSEDELLRQAQEIVSLSTIHESNVIIAMTEQEKDRIWKTRRLIREAISKKSPIFLAEDTVVPRASIQRFILQLKNEFKKQKLTSLMFGHAGDGNVHVDVLKGDMPIEQWRLLLPSLKEIIYQIAVECGGTISGEHGIGFIKRDYLPTAMDNHAIELMRAIKRAFDPLGILNPNKVI